MPFDTGVAGVDKTVAVDVGIGIVTDDPSLSDSNTQPNQ